MPERLHLIDDYEAPATGPLLRAARADIGHGDGLLLVGGERLTEAARVAGLRWQRRLGLPLGQPLLAPTAALRAFRAFREVKSVVAWTLGGLSIATTFLPRIPRRLMVLQWPDDAAGRRLERLMASGGFDAWADGNAIAERLVTLGLPRGRIHELPPPPSAPPSDRETAVAIEAAGAGSAEADAAAPWRVAVLADPPDRIDATDLCLAAELAFEVTGRDLELVMSPAARRSLEARRMLRQIGRGGTLQFDSDPIAALARHGRRGFDAVLLPAPGSPLATRAARRSGLPVIAAPHSVHAEGLSGQQAFGARSNTPRHLGHQLARVLRVGAGVEAGAGVGVGV